MLLKIIARIMKTVVKFFLMITMPAFLGVMSCAKAENPKIAMEEIIPLEVSLQKHTIPVEATTMAVVEKNTAVRTRILFTGDINLGRCIARRTLSDNVYTNNFNYPFQLVADDLHRADITVGSLDGSLSNQSAPVACSPAKNLLGPPEMVGGLRFAGFDVITIATNHIKDCGEQGFDCDNKAMFNTMDTLKSADIQPVGAGKSLSEARQPVIVERNGIRFAFLGISQIEKRIWAGENTPGVAPLAQGYIEQIKSDIAAARQLADVVIMLPHWGVEYAPLPDDIQRVWAQEFINAGASLVIGNHPHIIQPVDILSGKPVFYALGNFVFDQEHSFRRESIVVEVTFLGDQIEGWTLRAAGINYYTFQTYWVDESEATSILARAKGGQ
jgi:poly-gamma-glutamate synthesis protein (capsule biosynthesis protein)